MDAITPILTLLVILCGFSVLISPVLGRPLDPFILTRPLARWFTRLPARLFRRLARMFNQLSRASWKRADRSSSLLLKLSLYAASATLGSVGLFLTIPAELLGDIPKPKI
jgi:hypothetical protein